MSGELTDRPLADLLMRRSLGKWCIRFCRANNRPDSEAKYREQLKRINEAIKQVKWGGHPPAQTIGLDTLKMGLRRQ